MNTALTMLVLLNLVNTAIGLGNTMYRVSAREVGNVPTESTQTGEDFTGCGPQILDRRCSDRLNASGISYGMIGA